MCDNLKNTNTRMICVCCLSTKRCLIKLDKCKHGLFFTKILENKLNFEEMHVCTFCHQFIKKIDNFTRQVEQSVYLLNEKYEQFHTEQTLQMSAIELHYVTNNGLKHDILPNNSLNIDLNTEIKMEQDKSEGEDNLNDFETVLIPHVQIEESDKEIKTEVCIEENDTDTHNVVIIENSTDKEETKSLVHDHSYPDFKNKNKIDIDKIVKFVALSKKELLDERKREREKKGYIKKEFKCEDCVIGFTNEKTYENHKKQRHNLQERPFVCDVCMSSFNTIPTLKYHRRLHFVRYECIECGVRNADRLTMMKHYKKTHMKTSTFNCKLCSFSTKIYKTFVNHLYIHKERLPCKQCDRTFIGQHALNAHMNSAHGPILRSCQFCDKKFKTKYTLECHMLTHVKNKPTTEAVCSICQKSFPDTQMLEVHKKEHEEAYGSIACNECGDIFYCESKLMSHFDKKHIKIIPSECKICNKEFSDMRCLKKHQMYVHDKKIRPKKHICDYCERGFSTVRALKSHIRTHTGERPYKCELCDKTFAFTATFYTHMKITHNKQTKT